MQFHIRLGDLATSGRTVFIAMRHRVTSSPSLGSGKKTWEWANFQCRTDVRFDAWNKSMLIGSSTIYRRERQRKLVLHQVWGLPESRASGTIAVNDIRGYMWGLQ